MLTKTVINNSKSVLEQTMQENKQLEPVDGSYLQQLVDVTMVPEVTTFKDVELGEKDTFELTDILMHASRNTNLAGVAEHDQVEQTIRERVSESIMALHQLTRNDVKSHTSSLLESYQEHLENMALEGKNLVQIVPNVYHSIWAIQDLNNMVGRYENAPMNSYTFGYNLPMLEHSQLYEIITSGMGHIKDHLDSLIDNLPEGTLESVYRRVFVDRESPIGSPINSVHITPDGNLTRNEVLIAFLIALNFEDHIPDGVTVSLVDLRNALSKTLEQAGRVISLEISRRGRDIRSKHLVFKTETSRMDLLKDEEVVTVYVNNDVYKMFLDEGGSPETIYGAVLGKDSTDYEKMLAKKDTLERTWEFHVNAHNQKVSAKIFHNKREALRVSASAYMKKLSGEEELKYGLEKMHKRAEDFMSKLEPKDMENEANVIRDLICFVVYDNDSAKMIFKSYDTIQYQNPEMKPREVMLYATIDYLARWWASQIRVVQV